MKMLSDLQERNLIPTPPPGTRVTVVLLLSAAATLKYTNRQGIVVLLPEGQPAVKVGRAAVLFEGEATPISFKLMNLRVVYKLTYYSRGGGLLDTMAVNPSQHSGVLGRRLIHESVTGAPG